MMMESRYLKGSLSSNSTSACYIESVTLMICKLSDHYFTLSRFLSLETEMERLLGSEGPRKMFS